MLPPYVIAYIRSDHSPWASGRFNLAPKPITVPHEPKPITVVPRGPKQPPLPKQKVVQIKHVEVALEQKGEHRHHRRSHNSNQPGSCRCGCGGQPTRRRKFVAGHNAENGQLFRGECQ